MALPGEQIFLCRERTTPLHRKFYEVEVELSLSFPKVLVRRWGRIGTRRVRSIKRVLVDAKAVRRQVAEVSRLRRGYRQVAEAA